MSELKVKQNLNLERKLELSVYWYGGWKSPQQCLQYSIIAKLTINFQSSDELSPIRNDKQ